MYLFCLHNLGQFEYILVPYYKLESKLMFMGRGGRGGGGREARVGCRKEHNRYNFIDG